MLRDEIRAQGRGSRDLARISWPSSKSILMMVQEKFVFSIFEEELMSRWVMQYRWVAVTM